MISPELARKIRRLQITSGRAVNDILAGEYHSVFKGRGMEFSEVREYAPGDEIRDIDWNVTARQGRPYVKRYVEERELTVVFAVDLSASGGFGAVERTKNELAAELGALLAFSAIRNKDKVGLLIFTDAIEHYVPPGKGTGHVLRLIRDVLEFQPRGRGTDLAGALEYLGRVLRRRGVVFVVSDFQAKGYEQRLGILGRRHDVICVSVADPRELELPAAGLIELEDAESGRRVLIDSGSARFRREFAARTQARRRDRAETFRKLGVDQIDVITGQDYVRDLVAFFRRRERRLAR